MVYKLIRTYLCLSLYWRIQALPIEWDEGCPLVYSTCGKPDQTVLWRDKARYQIACSWFFSSVSAAFFSMNPQEISNSSVEPDSKPWESWKIKLLPGYVIWCSISCRPLCYHCTWMVSIHRYLTHLNWWHQVNHRLFKLVSCNKEDQQSHEAWNSD